MFLVQTGHARRTRKNSITMAIVFALFGLFGALLTMHVNVRPRKPPTIPEGGTSRLKAIVIVLLGALAIAFVFVAVAPFVFSGRE